MEKMFLAADSGGSKTEWVLINSDGEVIAKTKTKGLGAIKEGLLPVYDTVREAYDFFTEYDPCDYIFLSLGGPNVLEVEKALKTFWKTAEIKVERESSGTAMLAAAEILGAKAVVLCGTGSTAVGDTVEGRKYCGGWGPVYADGGSGGGLGTDALRLFLRSVDVLETESGLSEVFSSLTEGLELEKFDDRMELKKRVLDLDRRTVASFAPEIYKLYSTGDPAATELYLKAASEIAGMAFCVSDNTPDTKVIVCGGFLRNSPLLLEEIRNQFAQKSRAKIIYDPEFNPIMGAKIAVLRMGNIKTNQKLFEKLLNN